MFFGTYNFGAASSAITRNRVLYWEETTSSDLEGFRTPKIGPE